MFYVLSKNVYLVKGNTRGCIYDFNSSKLYSLNKELSDKVDLANQKGICVDLLDADLQSIFNELVSNGILTLSETAVTRHIEEIKLPDMKFTFAWIEVTNQCNLRCRHCYNESDIRCNDFMTLDNYKIVIDNLLSLGVKKVQLIGGEPFFDKPLLKDMLDYTVGKFPLIEIFTNGTLMSTEWFKYLSKNDIHVALSVYSYDENMHDAVTGCKGSFAKTNNTIKELKRLGITYRVCNVLMKDIDLGNRSTNLYELSPDKDVVRMSGRASFSLLSEELIRKKLITKKSFQAPISRYFAARLLSGHNCFNNRLYITANMDVFPCVMERRMKHCRIDKNHGINLDENIRLLNKDKVDECCLCEFRYACFDCRPNSLSGNLLEKPWYCTYDPLSGEWENEDEFVAKLREKWEK